MGKLVYTIDDIDEFQFIINSNNPKKWSIEAVESLYEHLRSRAISYNATIEVDPSKIARKFAEITMSVALNKAGIPAPNTAETKAALKDDPEKYFMARRPSWTARFVVMFMNNGNLLIQLHE